MTDGVRATIKKWTGYEPLSCPWRAFFDPFVARVIRAHHFFEKGELQWAMPRPSYRLVEGVSFYGRSLDSCAHHRMEQEREARARG